MFQNIRKCSKFDDLKKNKKQVIWDPSTPATIVQPEWIDNMRILNFWRVFAEREIDSRIFNLAFLHVNYSHDILSKQIQ